MKKEDNLQFTKAMMNKSKRFHELPENVQKGLLAIKRRGRPLKANPKKLITFRLDPTLVSHIKGVENYNRKVELALAKAIKEERL